MRIDHSLRLIALTLSAHSLSLAATYPVTGTLEQGQVVPPILGDAATIGSGEIVGTYNDASRVLTLRITYAGLTDVTGAGIHQGARGATGPLVFPINTPPTDGGISDAGSDAGDTIIVEQAFSLNKESAVDLLGQGLYANVRTRTRPAGSLRAQLVPQGTSDAGLMSDASQPLLDSGTVITPDASATSVESGEVTGGGCSTGGNSFYGLGAVFPLLFVIRRLQRKTSQRRP